MFLHDVVVGIDVASDSFVMAILAPDSSVYKQPKKYDMNKKGFTDFCSILNETKKWFNNSPKIFLESTGIYHRPLFLHLINNGFNAFIINPVSIKNITFDGLRKVKNDNRADLKLKLGNELHSGFPGFKNIFSDISGLTPLKFLEIENLLN